MLRKVLKKLALTEEVKATRKQWQEGKLRSSRQKAASILIWTKSPIRRASCSATEPLYLVIFRYRNRSAAEVRNVVLTGDWPEQLLPEHLAPPADR